MMKVIEDINRTFVSDCNTKAHFVRSLINSKVVVSIKHSLLIIFISHLLFIASNVDQKLIVNFSSFFYVCYPF